MQFIETIMLIGLMVTVSTLMIIWAKGHTETATQDTISEADAREQCNGVRFAAELTKISNCNSVSLLIENKGLFNIKNINAKTYIQDGSSSQEDAGELPIEGSIDLNIYKSPNTITSIEFLPSTEVNGKDVVCREKKLIVDCK